MKIEGSYDLSADLDRTWALLNDAGILADCIPGCKGLTPSGKNAYDAELSVGIGMIRGTYSGHVVIADQKPPKSYRLKVDGDGPGGFIKGDAVVTLEESATGRTTVTVAGEGEVGGMLARVGQRLVGQASKSLMKQFFDCLAKKAKAGA